jgi:sigma-B regulation protein RsbU (phosphoserine phosphatase)
LRSVNKHITADSYETGRFTTVSFVEIDVEARVIKWIRAGHEPAIFFTPDTGECHRLLGNGMALGVDADAKIYEHEIKGWVTGSILVIFSDGLKEARNPAGEMYGEKRIAGIIETHATKSAGEIEKKLIENLNEFCENAPIEDDITVVITKLL